MTIASVILLGLAAILSLVVGLLVFARDHSKVENVAFFGISLGIACWTIGIAGFVQAHAFSVALLWAKFYYLAPIVLVFSSLLFAQEFLYPKRFGKVVNALFAVGGLALILPLLLVKSFMTQAVIEKSYGKQVVLNDRQYLIYSLYLLLCFVIAIYLVYVKSRRAKQSLTRQQANIFLVGYSISCVLGVFFNLVLPGFGNYRLIILGPLLTTIFLFAVAFAIVRHKLFDVRLVVARTLGYAGSLIVLATVYGFVVFGTAELVFGLHFSILTQVFLSGATGIAGMAFGRFRKEFDRVTNRIFYRDAYDPQLLFDHLNKILVSTIDLDRLLRQSSSLIGESLKSEYCAIGLKEIGSTRIRIVSTEKKSFSAEDISKVRHLTPFFHQNVIAKDYLDQDRSALKDLLDKNNVSVLIRLSPDVRKTEEGLGYIVLGPKKSGNPYTNQDIRVLDTIAKELIIAIQNALRFEEIETFNLTLQDRINEATRKLRRTNEKLKEMDETKDDFISMASHQLRTPLTSVKGYISMVLEEDAGKITHMQREMLGQAFFSSQRMVYLIADLLNVSRLKTGKFIIEPARVNLADMVQQELEQLEETAASRSLTLQYDKPAGFPSVMLDETKTRQVIMNFVDNAIYYTPAGGHITVRLINGPNTIELRVEDNGIGVPKGEQHHLFTKFYRAGNARKARPDGTGLGLFMAKKVIVAEGGSIIFDSQEGKGSTFGFIFSKAKLGAHTGPSSADKKTPEPAKQG